MDSAEILASKTLEDTSGPSRISPGYLLSAYNPWLSQTLELSFDLAALAIAWFLTVESRVALNPIMAVQLTRLQLYLLAPPLNAIMLLWSITTLWLKARRSNIEGAPSALATLAESAIIVSTLTIVATFFSNEFGAPLSRSFVLLYAPISTAILFSARGLERFTLRAVAVKWMEPKRIAVLGDGGQAIPIVRRIRAAGAGVDFAGIILPESRSESGAVPGLPVLGESGRLAEVINSARLDHLIILSKCVGETEAERCSYISKRMGLIVSRALGPAECDTRMQITTRYGMNLLDVQSVSFTRRQELIKRVFDVLISGLLLVMLSPLLLLSAILIRLTSPGPVLYRSQRVGKGGRYFTFLKFRSMCVSGDRLKLSAYNETNGHLFKIRGDPRITPVGKVLRRYSIDELPQLINVLLGEMSLLGPRPLPAGDLEPDGMSKDFAVWAEQRARVLPGITGLWQIRGRSDLTFEEMMDLDISYIRDWSLLLDLKILLATPKAVLTGRGAY
jgi:exopolysaccharide biosynthesis polyprenyl glycosylphosphotransferase